MIPNEYLTADSFTRKEKAERSHFLAYAQNDLSDYSSIRPGDDRLAEPDIVVEMKSDRSIRGFEITELWLDGQARAVNTNQHFSIDGESTFSLLKPLRMRLNDKFQALRKDGKSKYSIPTTLLVVDRTSIPFELNSNKFYNRYHNQMKDQQEFKIDYFSTMGFFDRKTNGTPVNSVTIIQQLLSLNSFGSCVDSTFWFVPDQNIRVSIAYHSS